jgi:hypothetical protein
VLLLLSKKKGEVVALMMIRILLMPDTLLALKLLAKRSASFFLPREFRCRPWVRHIQEENMSKEWWSMV